MSHQAGVGSWRGVLLDLSVQQSLYTSYGTRKRVLRARERTMQRVPAHGQLVAAAAVCSMSCRRVAAPIRTVLPVGGAHPVGQGLVGIAPARATMCVRAGARGRHPRPPEAPERRHCGVREQSDRSRRANCGHSQLSVRSDHGCLTVSQPAVGRRGTHESGHRQSFCSAHITTYVMMFCANEDEQR